MTAPSRSNSAISYIQSLAGGSRKIRSGKLIPALVTDDSGLGVITDNGPCHTSKMAGETGR
uniref:Uncharacterized protein n=1 Tax=Anguilla anguilla TaxID=7936 RepID=A0A0E9RAZ3_ANGAN